MRLLRLLDRIGHTASRAVYSYWRALGILVLAGIGSVQLAEGQIRIQGFGRWPTGEQDYTSRVYLPSDRALSRAIERARERLAEREYHEALGFLHGILGREEDSFLERAGSSEEQIGLKATARRLIGELPPDGREAYELLFGAAARRALDEAMQSRNRDGVANIVRQYYHTEAGYEAALLLAQMEADQGHRLAAAQLYQELLDTPRAAARFEPQLSALAALNQLAAGNRDAAGATLKALVSQRQSAEIELSGQAALAPGADADLAGWLSQLVGEPSGMAPSHFEWLTVRGDPARNAQKPGGRPHLRPRWQARVVNDPAVESYIVGRLNDFSQRGVAVVPGARPIAVGDLVVMRTPDNVVAVNWQNGKRIWETREDAELDSNRTAMQYAARVENEQWGAEGQPLEQRVWDDALAMSLASDGKRVFVLRGESIADDEQMMGGWAPGFNRFGMGGEPVSTTNQLAAYDIATQGKLAWELDGSRIGPPLDGAFFLGAPLAIDNTLFVMAEIRSAIYLLALDPATGQLQWQQQLVGLEQGISLDPVRRRAGATPSYSGGILICPTAAGAVIAIDVVKREFAWVYRYSRQPQNATEIRNMWQNTVQSATVRVNDRWLDSAAVIADGRVLVTPPESTELHCLDLRTGKLAWKHRQGDSLFIGGVEKGRVLLVGAEGVQALQLSDGGAAWQPETTALPTGSLPAGQGYVSEGNYYLPLTSSEIVAIETASGKLAEYQSANPEMALGNLICYRGSILSQSALVLDKFEQLDILRQRAESALADNPNDATALRELAELKRADGDTPQAVKLLKQAFELAPDDPLAREMLAELLLEALASQYANYRDDVPLLSKLIHDREQQIELRRIAARGLEQLGDRLAAFDAHLRLADFTAEEPAYLRVGSDYSVRSDRWICGRLGSLWRDATDDERSAMADRLISRRPKLEDPRTAAELRHYLWHMAQLPGADEVRLALAKLLVDRKRAQEAEIELLELSACTDDEIRTAAAELMSKLVAESRPRDATNTSARWPHGRVDAELVPAPARMADGAARLQAERQSGYAQVRIEQDFSPNCKSVQWFVAMDCSELVGRTGLGEDVFQLAIDQNSWPQQQRDSSLVHAGRLGQLLFVALGGQVTAIDARHGGPGVAGSVLWQTDPNGRLSGELMHGRRTGTSPPRSGRRPVYHAYSGRKRMTGVVGTAVSSLGPVTPGGVVFQEHDQLKCVDPLSGEVLWIRTDIPAGCELFGDKERLFAADVSGRVAHVISMLDGRRLGSRPLPRFEWLITASRNVAELGFQINRNRHVLLLRISDIWSQDVLYEAEHPRTTRTAVVEPNYIAIYEPTGRFQLIDVRSGKSAIDEQLEAMPDVLNIYTMQSGDELYLLISNPPQQQFRPLVQQPDYPLVNGLVYAFNMTTGEPQWPGPALVRSRGIVLSQPQDMPLLVFADRRLIRDAARGGGSQLRVLCLDKRTGQTAYRNDSLPDTSITRFRVRAARDLKSTVAVEMSAGKIQLALTNQPRPPQPPANDDLEAPREVQQRGLRGIGERMSGALRGALDNKPADRRNELQRQMQEFQRGRQQAREKLLETDDD